jgi:hypothetical protein
MIFQRLPKSVAQRRGDAEERPRIVTDWSQFGSKPPIPLRPRNMPSFSLSRRPPLRTSASLRENLSRSEENTFLTRLRTGLLLACFALLLSGCLNLERAEPTRESFDFSPQLPRLATPSQGPILLVSYFAAEPQFATGEFVYRVSEVQWESDFYRHWVEAPATLLTDWSRRWLSGSGHFRDVGTPGLLAGSQATLQGRIIELYGDFRTESPSAVITLAFHLQPGGTKPEVPFWSKTYRRSIPLAQRNPASLVEAWSRGLEEILREVSRDVAVALNQNP